MSRACRSLFEVRSPAAARKVLDRAIDLAVAPAVQENVTRVGRHRPWPMPGRSWVMAQTWVDLLFAHWRVAPELLSRLVPPQLPLDTFEGSAWVGITPFEVRNLRLRPTLPLPALSSFPEINVRTYVTVAGKPGIYFFSLDADSAWAVAAARRLYRLPYFRARMAIERPGRTVSYRSERRLAGRSAPAPSFRATYRPLRAADRRGAPNHASDPLASWLTERYCLYTLDDRLRVLRGEIHHPLWPLEAAEAEIEHNTMAEPLGLDLRGPPLLHYARRQDVVFWSLQRASTSGDAAAGVED
jgi:uncharacterized protein YqjF (DUF2071 family)